MVIKIKSVLFLQRLYRKLQKRRKARGDNFNDSENNDGDKLANDLFATVEKKKNAKVGLSKLDIETTENKGKRDNDSDKNLDRLMDDPKSNIISLFRFL